MADADGPNLYRLRTQALSCLEELAPGGECLSEVECLSARPLYRYSRVEEVGWWEDGTEIGRARLICVLGLYGEGLGGVCGLVWRW